MTFPPNSDAVDSNNDIEDRGTFVRPVCLADPDSVLHTPVALKPWNKEHEQNLTHSHHYVWISGYGRMETNLVAEDEETGLLHSDVCLILLMFSRRSGHGLSLTFASRMLARGWWC